MQSRPFNSLMVLGTTASGKTRLAVRLARHTGAEIISLDSRQVYRHMNIGTGKDYDEYNVNGRQVPVHLLDVADAGTVFHLHQYLQQFTEVFNQLAAAGMAPVLCGGTVLYIQALLKGFEYTSVPVNEELRQALQHLSKPELTERFRQLPTTSYTSKADLSTARRITRAIEISEFLQQHPLEKIQLPKLKPLVFAIDLPREIRRQRIEARLQLRLNNGLIEETEGLLQKGVSAEQLICYGLEYKFTVQHLQGLFSREYLQEHLTIAIQQYAKRQMTWLRKLEREGLTMHWIDGTLPPNAQVAIALKYVNSSLLAKS